MIGTTLFWSKFTYQLFLLSRYAVRIFQCKQHRNNKKKTKASRNSIKITILSKLRKGLFIFDFLICNKNKLHFYEMNIYFSCLHQMHSPLLSSFFFMKANFFRILLNSIPEFKEYLPAI